MVKLRVKIYEVYDTNTGELIIKNNASKCSEALHVSTRWFKACAACDGMFQNRYRIVFSNETEPRIFLKKQAVVKEHKVNNESLNPISRESIALVKSMCGIGTELEIFRVGRGCDMSLPIGGIEKCNITGIYKYIFTVSSETGNFKSFTWIDLATKNGIRFVTN